MARHFKNLNKNAVIVDEEKYYNLSTSRWNKILPSDSIYLDEYRVYGNKDEIDRFKAINIFRFPIYDPPLNTQFCNLTEFDLCGLFTKARITEVIDGDTVSLSFLVPTTYLMSERSIYFSGLSRIFKFLRPKKIGLNFRCRLYGIDTPEMSTDKGVEARKKVIKFFEGLNNRVYVEFGNRDKYGRLLVILYQDRGKTISINELFVNTGIANRYYGGHK